MGSHHRIIYNDDGGTLFRPFVPNTDVPFSLEGFLDKAVEHLVGTQVGVLTWTLGTDPGRCKGQQGVGRATNMYCHQTDVGERFYELEPPYETASWDALARNVRTLIAQGHDPPRAVIGRGHHHGLKVFLGFRMNDCHDGRVVERDCPAFFGTDLPMRYPVFRGGRFFPENIRGHICRLKLEHPELLIGEHDELTRVCSIAFDYAHEPVRAFRLALIREACEKYDLDGVELDFLRHPIYFQPGEEATGMRLMTEFMGHVRDVLDSAGRTRGKRLALAVRVLAPFPASEAVGLDVRTWLARGWIDALIAGVCDRAHVPLGEIVRTAHRHDCPVYASVKVCPYGKLGVRPEVFRGIAANHYRAGADGIYFFNMSGLRDVPLVPDDGLGPDCEYHPLREVGSFESIRFADKHYVLNNKAYGHKAGLQLVEECSEAMLDRILRSELGTATPKPELPARLMEDTPTTIHFGIADDEEEARQRQLGFGATVILSMEELTMGEHVLEVSLNGTELSRQEFCGELRYRLHLPVRAACLECGANEITLTLRRKNPGVRSELRLNDLQVRIEYRPHQ